MATANPATYEALLDADLHWALEEASVYFEEGGRVHHTLQNLAARLDSAGINYALVGALAMFFHGYRRFTQDVDILVTPTGLERIEQLLFGQGYWRPSDWHRGMRDCETGVAVHIFLAGSPSNRTTKLSFPLPYPREIATGSSGIKIASLPALLELKMSLGQAPASIRHLADAQAMIQALDLPMEYRDALKPEFSDEYEQLWQYAQVAKTDDY